MARIVEIADHEVRELLIDVMKEHHRPLIDAEVKVGVVMVTSDSGVPVSLHGARCLAKCRRHNERERLLTKLDACIEIDAEDFDELSPERQKALLDHELTHLQLDLKKGRVSHYADGRPRLKMRPDDWVLTGFIDVVKRHGANANEAVAIEELVGRQMMFPFALKPHGAQKP